MKTIKRLQKDARKTIRPTHKGYTPEHYGYHIEDLQQALIEARDARIPTFTHFHLPEFQSIVSEARAYAFWNRSRWLQGVCNDFADVVNDYYTETLPGLLLAYPKALIL